MSDPKVQPLKLSSGAEAQFGAIFTWGAISPHLLRRTDSEADGELRTESLKLSSGLNPI
jgi:hypothetical protein